MVNVNWSNVSNFSGMASVPNTTTEGWFFTVILYMVYIIAIIIQIGFGLETAILTSSFLGIILSMLLAYAGLVSWWVVGSFVGAELFTFLYIYWSSNRD